VTSPTTQGLTLAVTLYDCPPLRARLTERACQANQARLAAAKKASGADLSATIDRDRFAGCEGCPGVVALAQRSEVTVTRAGPPPAPERRTRRRINPGPDPRGHAGQQRRAHLGRAEASVARKIIAAPPRKEEEDPMPQPSPETFRCECGRSFSRAQALGKHRLSCPKATAAVRLAAPKEVTQETVAGWSRELADLTLKAALLRRRIAAARALGIVASLAAVLLLSGCDQVQRLADRIFREPCARLCHDFAGSTPRPPTAEPVCRCADGSAFRFVGPGAVERVYEDGKAELVR
jgi:hypothetical protein